MLLLLLIDGDVVVVAAVAVAAAVDHVRRGSGYYGQLAQGGRQVAFEPEVVEYFVGVHLLVKSIAAGSHHCLAITQDNELYSWGSNNYGCLGRYSPSV